MNNSFEIVAHFSDSTILIGKGVVLKNQNKSIALNATSLVRFFQCHFDSPPYNQIQREPIPQFFPSLLLREHFKSSKRDQNVVCFSFISLARYNVQATRSIINGERRKKAPSETCCVKAIALYIGLVCDCKQLVCCFARAKHRLYSIHKWKYRRNLKQNADFHFDSLKHSSPNE